MNVILSRGSVNFFLFLIVSFCLFSSSLVSSSAICQRRVERDFLLGHNPFRYSCYYWDAESKMGYLKARYYSLALMRFISRDTSDLLNRYSYCSGDPQGRIDPGGHLDSNIDWMKLVYVAFSMIVTTSVTTSACLRYNVSDRYAFFTSLGANFALDFLCAIFLGTGQLTLGEACLTFAFVIAGAMISSAFVAYRRLPVEHISRRIHRKICYNSQSPTELENLKREGKSYKGFVPGVSKVREGEPG